MYLVIVIDTVAMGLKSALVVLCFLRWRCARIRRLEVTRVAYNFHAPML